MGASNRSPSMRWGVGTLSAEQQGRFLEGLAYCERFLMGQGEAQKALFKLTAILESEGIPYVVIGALALNAYGHRRVTVDVDIILRDEDLAAFKSRHLGQGYAERVPGTGKLVDTEFGAFPAMASPSPLPSRTPRRRPCGGLVSRSCPSPDFSS
ncbi:MAG TPA: hypothetical protein VFV75_07565 [Candidatus Polarisedimenticolaceae bacterium]|nr:hypothetical protein [Candidatus Polarisedimenticolaceae bacterium]